MLACGKTTLDLRGEEVVIADADVPVLAPVETAPPEATSSPSTQPSESNMPPPRGSDIRPPDEPPPPDELPPPAGSEECTSNDTCPLERPMCDPGRGRCVECFVNSHCPGGEICNGLRAECMVGCFRNSDCSRVQECDVLQTRCVECVTSQHCYFDLHGPERSVCAYNECRACDAEHPCFGSLVCIEGRCEQLGPPMQPSGPSTSPTQPNDRPPPQPSPYGPNPGPLPDEPVDTINEGPDAGDGGLYDGGP